MWDSDHAVVGFFLIVVGVITIGISTEMDGRWMLWTRCAGLFIAGVPIVRTLIWYVLA